jgi:hypothetical protein
MIDDCRCNKCDQCARELEAARQQLAERDVVPRSRYNACNADWLAEKTAREEQFARSTEVVTKLEQQLAEMRGALDTAATAFRTGFLPPSDWLNDAHRILGLPPTTQSCWQREPNTRWQDMSTFSSGHDDLVWLCKGNSVDGPRAPQIDDPDVYEWWCLAEPPSLPQAALAPTSQPSRGKCETCDGAKAIFEPHEPGSPHKIIDCPDCAQPERQGADIFPADYNGRELYDLAPKKPPSPPPTDDIVAGLRKGISSIRRIAFEMPAPNQYTPQFISVAIAMEPLLERLDRAIAALKGAKYKQRPIVAENSLPSPPLGAS